MIKYDHIELARTIGQPLDPRKKYTDLISKVCTTDTAEPGERIYYFDALVDTNKIYVITSTGEVTQENVSPDTDTALTFIDIASPEYYVKLTDLAGSVESSVLGRKKATINRALNAEENRYIISLMNTACVSQGNVMDMRSGESRFNYQHLVELLEMVVDYSDDYALVAGSQVAQDVVLWNWTDNKYHDLLSAFKALNVELVRIGSTESVQREGAGVDTDVITSTTAYIVGRNNVMGRPVLFVRKKLNDIEKIGGLIQESGEKPERLIFVSPNPIQVSSTRYLAVGMTGWEEIVAAVTNPYALGRFQRTV